MWCGTSASRLSIWCPKMITDTMSNRVQAIFLKGHLRLLAVGLQPPRGVRKGDILKKASAITGVTYARTGYMDAASDLQSFLDTCKG
jgi:hypothetical protein